MLQHISRWLNEADPSAKDMTTLGVDRQDIATMAAEALMAPVVACVIFFLLEKTGITEISAAGESTFVVLGFAFVLGYAIRRTVGILDNIKKRLLPDP